MKFERALVEIFGERSSEFSDDLRSRLHELFCAGAEAQRRMTDVRDRAANKFTVDDIEQARQLSRNIPLDRILIRPLDQILIRGNWKP